jgi:signal transduction histidine kinase
MSAAAWVAIVLVGLGTAAIGLVVGRRSLQLRFRQFQERAESSEEALARREQTSREDRAVQDLILGSMQEGILLFDGDWQTAFANDALERHLRARPASVQQLFPLPARELVERVSNSREAESAEVEFGSPERWLRVSATPAGSDGSVLVVVADITERRRMEQVRRDFVANASHELKTPAASIQAAAETLADAALHDPAAVARFAPQLERDAQRLSRIVTDLLDLSRLEVGSDLGDHVRLDAIVRDEVERYESHAQEAGLVLQLRARPTPAVRGSARDLSLLVRNLIDNAVRYTREGGTVEVSVGDGDGDVTVAVQDDGIGIPTKDLPRVFERFFRVDRARSRGTGGTGLGLSIVKHVAENHGGTVEVRSELGRGSVFTVTLPVMDDRHVTPVAPDPAAPIRPLS